uniref:non-specific serine/threonine protein kinase n=1 Tax=Cacopsylla melanoneura TaxID=428564 RepID=A0A8D8ZZS4_9HEMI
MCAVLYDNTQDGLPSFGKWNLAYSTQSDIWAMGCVLYFTTTHKMAFQASNLGSIVNNILHGVITDLLDQDQYDERLPHLIASMLEREPEHRPNTHQLMAHCLLVPHVYGIMLNHGLDYGIMGRQNEDGASSENC